MIGELIRNDVLSFYEEVVLLAACGGAGLLLLRRMPGNMQGQALLRRGAGFRRFSIWTRAEEFNPAGAVNGNGKEGGLGDDGGDLPQAGAAPE